MFPGEIWDGLWKMVLSAWGFPISRNLVLPREISWENMLVANNIGAVDCLGKEQCRGRINCYRRAMDKAANDKEKARAERMMRQWKVKLDDVVFREGATGKYDRIAGKMEVLTEGHLCCQGAGYKSVRSNKVVIKEVRQKRARGIMACKMNGIFAKKLLTLERDHDIL